MSFQFTPVLRRATRAAPEGQHQLRVSIHARLATGDSRPLPPSPELRGFNSRPSCDGRRALTITGDGESRFNSRPSCDGRLRRGRGRMRRPAFQFTPVLRRATEARTGRRPGNAVSIHARLATGDCCASGGREQRRVSIHARLATGDVAVLLADGSNAVFQFTPVLRRATAPNPKCIFQACVSIHARLATGDIIHYTSLRTYAFQFTPVLRRATRLLADFERAEKFQFTPVLRRATTLAARHGAGRAFQFTPVLRRATASVASAGMSQAFQFTPVLRRAT